MLFKKGVHCIHFVQRNRKIKILLRQCNVVVHLEGLVKVLHLTQIEQKPVDAFFVLMDERLQLDHVWLFRVRGLVGQVLQHLRYLCELSV